LSIKDCTKTILFHYAGLGDFSRGAVDFGLKAIEQGMARLKLDRSELFQTSEKNIKKAIDEAQSHRER
jgi:hypothetical protein